MASEHPLELQAAKSRCLHTEPAAGAVGLASLALRLGSVGRCGLREAQNPLWSVQIRTGTAGQQLLMACLRWRASDPTASIPRFTLSTLCSHHTLHLRTLNPHVLSVMDSAAAQPDSRGWTARRQAAPTLRRWAHGQADGGSQQALGCPGERLRMQSCMLVCGPSLCVAC